MTHIVSRCFLLATPPSPHYLRCLSPHTGKLKHLPLHFLVGSAANRIFIRCPTCASHLGLYCIPCGEGEDREGRSLDPPSRHGESFCVSKDCVSLKPTHFTQFQPTPPTLILPANCYPCKYTYFPLLFISLHT